MAVVRILKQQVDDVQETDKELVTVLPRISSSVVKLRGENGTGALDPWVQPKAINFFQS